MSAATRYKYPLNLPVSLEETAARLAKDDGVSLSQWIVTAAAQTIGAGLRAHAHSPARSATIASPGPTSCQKVLSSCGTNPAGGRPTRRAP